MRLPNTGLLASKTVKLNKLLKMKSPASEILLQQYKTDKDGHHKRARKSARTRSRIC